MIPASFLEWAYLRILDRPNSYTYDANYNRTGKSLANGVTSTLTYDNAERLTSITDLTPSPTAGTLLQKFQYGYDAMSRLTYVKRNNGVGDVYGYDAADQLTSVQYNCTNPDTTPTNPSQTVAYSYDNAGNRTQVLDSVNGTSNYTPNLDNQYSSVGTNTATYDGRGNLTALGGNTYSYDANNLLLSFSDSFADSVTQAYDPLGRCVKRTINGVITYFVYDLNWRLLSEYNSSGVQSYRYVSGPQTNEIVSRTDSSSNVIYYHTDGLGSITKLTSSTGALLEQYSYDAFGQTTIENASGTTIASSAYGNRFMYTGAELVSPMNLYNNRNRFYSPSLGRFLQPDPIGHLGDGYNIYRYCGNSPVNTTDPMGEAPPYWYAQNPNNLHDAYGEPVQDTDDNTPGGKIVYPPDNGGGTGDSPDPGDGTLNLPSPTAELPDTSNWGSLPTGYGGNGIGPIGEYNRNGQYLGTGTRFLPDYISLSINVGSWVGWSGTLSVDRYGDWFYSPLGLNAGKSVTILSFSLTANSLNSDTGQMGATQPQLINFLTNSGLSGTFGGWGGLNGGYTPGSGTSFGGGLVSPQIGISYNYSFHGPGSTGVTW